MGRRRKPVDERAQAPVVKMGTTLGKYTVVSIRNTGVLLDHRGGQLFLTFHDFEVMFGFRE